MSVKVVLLVMVVLLVPEVLLCAGDDGHVAGPAVHLLHRRDRAHAHRRVQAGDRA